MTLKYRSVIVAFIIFAACGLTLIAISMLERDTRHNYILVPLKPVQVEGDTQAKKELPLTAKPCL